MHLVSALSHKCNSSSVDIFVTSKFSFLCSEYFAHSCSRSIRPTLAIISTSIRHHKHTPLVCSITLSVIPTKCNIIIRPMYSNRLFAMWLTNAAHFPLVTAVSCVIIFTSPSYFHIDILYVLQELKLPLIQQLLNYLQDGNVQQLNHMGNCLLQTLSYHQQW